MSRLLVAAFLLVAGCGGGEDFAPRGTLPDAPGAFAWPGWKDATTYELLVFRADDSVLFHRQGLTAEGHPIDRDLRRRLLGAREFTWVVRGWAGEELVGRSERIPVRLEPGSG